MALANITALADIGGARIGITGILIILMIIIIMLKAVKKVFKVIFTFICVAAIYFIMHGGLS